MSVNRYDFEDYGTNEPDGRYVTYEDYAALEDRCAALAAELQSVKAMNDCLSEELRGYESDGAFDGPKMHLLWWQCETPNHDAFMAEVRASALDEFARAQDEQAKKYYEMSPGCSAQDECQFAASQAWYFAECIRKGVQS